MRYLSFDLLALTCGRGVFLFPRPRFKGGKSAGSKPSADDWDCGTLAFTFNTAESFWAMYNNVTPASKLPDKSDYYLFVDGIKPKYEDPVRLISRALGDNPLSCRTFPSTSTPLFLKNDFQPSSFLPTHVQT